MWHLVSTWRCYSFWLHIVLYRYNRDDTFVAFTEISDLAGRGHTGIVHTAGCTSILFTVVWLAIS